MTTKQTHQQAVLGTIERQLHGEDCEVFVDHTSANTGWIRTALGGGLTPHSEVSFSFSEKRILFQLRETILSYWYEEGERNDLTVEEIVAKVVDHLR